MNIFYRSTLALFLFTLAATAQTPTVSSATTTVPICAEVCTIVSTTGTNVVYQFGAGTAFNTITKVTYPLVVNCGVAADCAPLGGDPAPNVVKTVSAIEQATPYTVTWTNAAGVSTSTTVPALPAPPSTLTFNVTLSINGTSVTGTCTAPLVGVTP